MVPGLHISIPITSIATPSGSKPFTQYHIQLQLPLRKHEVRKRYSEFETLHKELTAQTSQPPPALLPAKSWLRRTVNSDALTEERRQGLEKYVRAIVEAEDARWRSSNAWRSFLNLPGGASPATANGAPTKGGTRKLDGGVSDPNQWLDVHRDLKSQIQAARSQLKQREAATTAQQQHSLSAVAKASLVRAATTIAQLDDGLRSISDAGNGDEAGLGGSKKLGDGEIRRRRDLLGAARKEVEGLEGVLRSMATKTQNNTSSGPQAGAVATAADKAQLWNGISAAKSSGRVLGGPLKETERTRELDNSGLLQLQQQIMREQDEDVLSLGKTVAKLKDMGILINEELTVQNEMLGLLEGDVDRHQGKLDVARSRIKKIS